MTVKWITILNPKGIHNTNNFFEFEAQCLLQFPCDVEAVGRLNRAEMLFTVCEVFQVFLLAHLAHLVRSLRWVTESLRSYKHRAALKNGDVSNYAHEYRRYWVNAESEEVFVPRIPCTCNAQEISCPACRAWNKARQVRNNPTWLTRRMGVTELEKKLRYHEAKHFVAKIEGNSKEVIQQRMAAGRLKKALERLAKEGAAM